MNSQFLDKNAYGKFTASKRRSLQCLPPLKSKQDQQNRLKNISAGSKDLSAGDTV